MPTVQSFPAGGYRFISHQFQYSGGVAAEPGFRVERARFARPLPLAEGFDAIEAYLAGIGRSPTAFCACELRSPAQFTDAGFVAFNRHYVERLAAWGIFRGEVNPVARSNVCPEIAAGRPVAEALRGTKTHLIRGSSWSPTVARTSKSIRLYRSGVSPAAYGGCLSDESQTLLWRKSDSNPGSASGYSASRNRLMSSP